MRVFGARNRAQKPGAVCFAFEQEQRRVGVYYFYVYDREFGPGFIKICTHFPYPAKVWLNGHEWAKRQAARLGIAFASLSNGFASCAELRRLQTLCDRFGPDDVQALFDRWTAVPPTPFTAADRPPAPPEMRRALAVLERGVADYVTAARLGAPA